MPTIPTGRLELELRRLYMRWVAQLPNHQRDVAAYTEQFRRQSTELIEKMGGRVALMGAYLDFPAPKTLDLSPHVGTIYSDLKQAAISAGITTGLNPTDVARAMMRSGMDKSFNRLNRLARTETVSAYWKNAWDSTEGLGLVMLWGAENGPRTCQWCRERDGLVMASPNLRDHPNGRCTPIPTLPSQVEYRGSVRADGTIFNDPDWAKVPGSVASAPAQTPIQQWVEEFKAANPGLDDYVSKELVNLAGGDQYAAKRLYNSGFGQISKTQFNQANKALKGQRPKSPVRAAPTPATAAPKLAPQVAPTPTEPQSKLLRGLSKTSEDEVARYTANSFAMNSALRNGVVPEGTDLLDQALATSKLPRATRVVRVVDGDAGEAALRVARSKGTYTDPAFVSTQKSGFWDVDELIDNFAMSGGKPVVFEYNLPPGYSAIDIGGRLDDHPLALGFNQGEVLLPRNARFRASAPINKGDYWLIRLTPI